jgi:hypothetical protein
MHRINPRFRAFFSKKRDFDGLYARLAFFGTKSALVAMVIEVVSE